MKIIIIGGFLGAGKTSLISHVIGSYTQKGQKVALIENEFSPSGVDASYLEQEGILVRELAAGCICCRLKTDLQSALKQIVDNYSPDVLFIEPSGAAIPEQVKDGIDIRLEEEPLTLMVVDLARFNSIGIKRYPFLEQSIKVADVVLLNKCDMVDEKVISETEKFVCELNPDATSLSVSLKTKHNMDAVLEALSQSGRLNNTEASNSSGVDHLVAEQPVAAAYEMTLVKSDISDIENGMQRLIQELKDEGCSLLGHVKASIQDKLGSKVFLSATSFDSAIEIKQSNSSLSNELKVKLNVIVYGIKKAVLDTMLVNVFQSP